MRIRVLLIAAIAVIAMAAAPALAYGATLTNDFGLAFAGQAKCIECHSFTEYGDTYHGVFARAGLIPAAPTGWTNFRAAGDPAVVAGTAPIMFTGGGSYAVSLQWITLGAFKTGLTEYIFFRPGADPTGKSWWNLVEGMTAEPGEGYLLSEATTGLYDVKYGCGGCHMLGYQDAAAAGTINPNTHFTSQATSVTPSAWAMMPGADKNLFASWVPGLGIACENCHGTGVAAASSAGGHWNSGVKIVGSSSIGKANSIIDSQVCGQCHGAGGKKVAALSRATIGYTPDQPLGNWLDLYTVSKNGIKDFVTIPTEASFTANPSFYKYYPNGINYNLGSHMYYTEWATTGHSYRGQYTSASPDALAYQKGGSGHFNAKTSASGCSKCHTGEGYLIRKGAAIAAGAVNSTSTVGFAGQECVTCHTGHPGAEGIPGGQEVLRAPEPGNNSLCEDCHNWQSEMMGTTVVPVATGKAVSHPTREVYNGRGMFEIPAMGTFMPGVKCEECHAVMANRSANRPAHAFKIMLPGDAERWSKLSGVVVGQDSCTVCHVESREDLQASIDTWKADAAAVSAQLTTAITAAKLRSEFTTTGGTYLVAVGWTNQYFYTGEGSMGAHNPPYIQTGLKKGLQLAKSVGGSFATVSAPSAPVAPSTLNAVAGKIVNGDGSGAAGGALSLLVGGSPVGTTVSDASGNFAFSVAPAATTSYVVRWERSSNAATHLLSDAKTITVAVVKIPTTITVRTSRTSAFIGQVFVLSGLVTPSPDMIGRNMHADVKKPNRAYWTYSSARTIYSNAGVASWWYRYTLVSGMVRGTYQFKAVYDGDATYAPSQSPIVSVLVR